MKSNSDKHTFNKLSRRDAIQNIAVLGIGGIASPVLHSDLSVKDSDKPVPGNGTSRSSQTKLTVKDVYTKAREAMYPVCRVCPQCDGVACSGEPAIGGIGSGMAFQNNYLSLQRIRLKMRTLVDDPALANVPDTSTTIFGRKLSFPAIAAPLGPNALQLGKGMTKESYFDAIIGGCVDAGAAGGIGDNASLPVEVFKEHCSYIAAVKGLALIGIKPRPAKLLIPLLPIVEAAGTFMITIDTDTGGRYPISDLREITRASKVPIVVKGVMTIDDAKRAADAGAAGIVISNHGGRRLDHTPGVAEVMPEIASEMKGKLTIFADGCVHYGTDLLKYLALGADAVLVGRHIVRAAFGGGREGVALFMNTMQSELAASMSMTAVSSIKKINSDILA